MKKRFPVLLIILALISVVAVIGYRFYERSAASPQPPVISFDGGIIDVPTNASAEQLLKGVTATDPEDGDVSASLIVEGMSTLSGNNNVKVNYIAFDSKNNMARAERTVHLTDYVEPKFTMSSALCIKQSNNIDVLKNVGAIDMIDGDISGKVKYSLEGDNAMISGAGEYEISLRVTNSLGQTARLPMTVEVTQSNPNPANITLSEYLVYLDNGADFDAKSYVVGYNADGTQVSGAGSLKISGKVDTKTAGIYTVEYSYGSGANASHTRLVVVVE